MDVVMIYFYSKRFRFAPSFNYHIMYVNQHYVSYIIDGGKLKGRCDLVLFTPVNLCT